MCSSDLDYGATRLYANDTGSLAEGTPPTTINAMGGSIVDHDRDGDPDLYITGTGPDGLYANDDGWIDVSAAAAAMGDNDLGRMHLGSVAADLDNDGWTDLVAVAGRWGGDDGLLRNQDLVEPDAIRLNTEGHFAAADLGFGDDGDNTSVVAADLDGDGTLELVEGTVGGPSHVWRSPCVAAWSVEVEPVGGLGSTVIAHTSAGDRYGRVALGTGLLGTGPPRAWIGLGDARLQGLTVRWPDGIEQEVETTTPGRIRVERE